MNHIQVLEQEIKRLDSQVTQSLANYNAMLGAHVFAKQLLAKLKSQDQTPTPNKNINKIVTNTNSASIPPM